MHFTYFNPFATAAFSAVTLLYGTTNRSVALLKGPSTTTYFRILQTLSTIHIDINFKYYEVMEKERISKQILKKIFGKF